MREAPVGVRAHELRDFGNWSAGRRAAALALGRAARRHDGVAQLPGFAAEEFRERLRIPVAEHPGVFAGEVLLQEGVVAADGEGGLSHVQAVARSSSRRRVRNGSGFMGRLEVFVGSTIGSILK